LNVDIALDSYPYNGTTTTIEALLMGVPVITRCGDAHRSRVTPMMLRQIGKHDWIAEDEDGYVQNAVRLAGEVERVRTERGDLRNLVEQSALMDGPAYGQKLGAAIRAIWTAECRR
jgi:predicted O-linked N-acetylglucosamine transferase (SPINDLY family)